MSTAKMKSKNNRQKRRRLALELLEDRCLLAAGAIDTSFGTNGIFRVDLATNAEGAARVAVQPDGKLVTAGSGLASTGNWDFVVARFLVAGGLDPSFGTGGKVVVPIGTGDDFAESLVIQPDGRILVVGSAAVGSNADVALIRLTISGALDTTFGAQGKVITPFGSGNETGRELALAANGDIFVAGDTIQTNQDMMLLKYNSLGILDNSFDGDGKLAIDFGPGEAASSLAVQSNGSIAVSGYRYNGTDFDFAIARVTSTGAPDNLFGTLGKFSFPIGTGADYASSMVMLPSGDYVLAGFTTTAAIDDFAIARVRANGQLETSFGTLGKTVVSVGVGNDRAQTIAVQPDGKLLIAGLTTSGSNTDMAIVRLTANGVDDPLFNESGRRTIAVVPSDDLVYSVALQGVDKAIVLGTSNNGTKGQTTLARVYIKDDVEVGFGNNGKSVISSSAGQDRANDVALDPSGKPVLAGSVFNVGTNDDWAITRFTTTGSTDSTFGTNGLVTIPFGGNASDSATSIATDGTSILIAGTANIAGTNMLTIAKLTSTGALDLSFDGNSGVGNGKVSVDFGPGFQSFGEEILVLPDHKILVAGYRTANSTGFGDIVIVRLLADGTLDTTFGSVGRAIVSLTSSDDRAYGMALQSDGKILVCGYLTNASNNKDAALVRLSSIGQVDTTFGSLGATTYVGAGNEVFYKVSIQSDEKMVAAGSGVLVGQSDSSALIARYQKADGALDGQFGARFVDFSTGEDAALGLTIQNDGRILVSGTSAIGQTESMSLARLTASGAIDLNFGNGGTSQMRFASQAASGGGLAVDSANNRVIVAGRIVGASITYDLAVASYIVSRAPTNLTLSSSVVAENAAFGATVGFFSTSDPDATDSFTYTLVNGAGSTDNVSFQIVGNRLVANAVYDFESKSIYSIRVRTTDFSGESFERIFSIEVLPGFQSPVLDINAIPNSNGSNPGSLTVVGSTIYFSASTATTGAELWKSDGINTVVVKDIAPGSGSSILSNLVGVNGLLYFSADDGVNGSELWKSDGTSSGTVLVKDILAGSSGANPQLLTNVNGTVYFRAGDGINGSELWKSDGTAAGTVLVKDIRTGTSDAYPTNLTNVNGTVYFRASDGINGSELWKSDGTAAGTVLVKDIFAGNNGANPTNLTNVNGTVYFRANDGTNGFELWRSDGTAAGTELVKDIRSGISSSSPTYLTNVNGSLFFKSNDGTTGYELWKSDGTSAGTVLIKDIQPSPANYALGGLTNINGIVYFKAINGVNGAELWRSDGTSAGTVMVKDIFFGTGSGSPYELTNVNGIVYFRARDSASNSELWKSDGTSAGTVQVKDIRSGQAESFPQSLTNVNGTLFLTANDGALGTELWRSDGTTAGTVVVKDIRTGTSSASPTNLTNANGTIYFSASDGINGNELWKSDGTAAGTVLVKDIRTGTSDASPRYLTNVNGTVYFSASDGINGGELWKSDGTTAGTVLVKDIRTGTSDASPRFLTNVNEMVYFSASDGINGNELWKSDGTAAGTILVKDIRTGTSDASPRYLTNVNGTVYFRAFDGINGYELWKSDGTAAGTILVKDIRTGTNSANPQYLTNVNGTLYFKANDGINGYELWKSDGTAAGTVLVKDIRTGTNSANPTNLANVNGTVFFRASDVVNGYELWKSDGTSAGTVLVKDILTGTYSANPTNLTNVNGTVYFRAGDGINGYELWKSDGTAVGTSIVKDIFPGLTGGGISRLTNFNGLLYFQANDGVRGDELWKSDGTSAGTVIAMDVNPVGGSAPGNLLPVGSSLFFTATTDAFGVELHQTNAAPIAISLSHLTLDENSPLGSVIGQLSTADPSLNDRHAYTFVGGVGDTDNALFGIEGGYVTVATLLDYETKPTYSIRVRSTDQAGEFIESTFTITVTDRLLEPMRDLNQTPGPTNSAGPANQTIVGNLVYFTAEGTGTGIELWRTDGTPGGTFMVRDINAGELSSYPAKLTNVGGLLYFQANDGINGDELWKSDGTAAGTAMVKDVRPGASSPVLNSLLNVNGTLFFQANDGTNGSELWKSNGTASGTVMVANIRAGSLSSRPSQLTNLNGTLLFSATDGTGGYELWKSDGTSAGTTLVKDIVSGATSSNPLSLSNVGGVLLFVATTSTEGNELWKSDGTAAGTVLVKDIRTGTSSSSPTNFLAVGNTVYFAANDGTTGAELWKSDGTSAGTVLVKDARTGTVGSSPANLTDIGGTVYFTANDGSTGTELWTSNGTTAGTMVVKDIQSGTNSSAPFNLTNLNGSLFFQASDGITGPELWKSNGTAAGTLIVKDIRAGNVGAFPGNLIALGNSIVFSADDNVSGRELWLSNGTQAGSVLLKDIKQGTASSKVSNPIDVNGTLFFAGSDGLTGLELWKTDGSSGTTVLVKDIAVGAGSSSPQNFTIVGSTLYFTADNGVDGEELWKTDGTTVGTVMVRNIPNGPMATGSMPHELTNVSGMLYFVVSNSQSGSDELWKSDGTLAGTDNFSSIALQGQTKYLTNVNGILYMRGNGGNGTHLWRTDGTSAGTSIVSPINPGPLGSMPSQLTNVNGTLFFAANDGTNGYELWKTNGTSPSTVLVKDIEPGQDSSLSPFSFGIGAKLTNVGGVLYFSALTAAFGTELWKSDGTTAGTIMIADLNPGPASSIPTSLTNVNELVYFAASNVSNSTELWKTDGTSSGTSMVKDINPGPSDSSPNSLINLNGVLYMIARDDVHGFELWKSDGTSTGTVMVDEIVRGFNSSSITSLTGSASAIYFVATTQTFGAELYRLATNSAPQSIAISSTTVAENLSAGATVGLLSAVDPDAGDLLTFSLPNGVGDNSSFAIVGSTLNTANVFNYEVKSSYSISVRVIDAAGLYIDRPFTINVTNVNEVPVLTRSQVTVAGNVLSTLTNSGTWSDPEADTVTLTASLGTVVKNANGTWDWSYTPTTQLVNQAVTITANDGANTTSVSFTISANVAVLLRGLAYNGATGTSASTSLATDKVPLLPGQSSTFANYTNYSRGLNAIVFDVAGLPSSTTNAEMLASLQFAQWNGIAAAGFTSLSSAAIPSVSILAGAGTGGSTRVRMTFPDNTVQNTWLRITVLANAQTGLSANDVFYFGNVIGELDFGNTATRLRVNGQDAALILANQSPGANSANVTNKFDLDRNGRVNGQDYAILLANQQAAGIVAPITAPSARVGQRALNVGEGEASGGYWSIPTADQNSAPRLKPSATDETQSIGPRWTGQSYNVNRLDQNTDSKMVEGVAVPFTSDDEPSVKKKHIETDVLVSHVDRYFAGLEIELAGDNVVQGKVGPCPADRLAFRKTRNSPR